MKNYIAKGDIVEFTAPSGGVTSGGVVKIGSLVGVAQNTAAEGEKFQLVRVGVFDVPKTEAQAWAEGVKVYWTGTEVTTTASGNTLMGAAAEAAANPSTIGRVILNGTV